jgi:GT2 family glycosyltransferase
MTVAAVVIGRNEGERLLACLGSLSGRVDRIIYVDSGSTDGSVDRAGALGAEVIELERTVPFTAARARNAGLSHLAADPDLRFVQFVDGDCEVRTDWVKTAETFLVTNAEVAVVCGRRRERNPDATIWNRLIDEEWAAAPGKVKACGGDAMMRLDAIWQVGGFDPTLIAGEEPELCVRLRARGWQIWRLEDEMTLHDAAMTRFGQWWQRSRRAGYTYAEGVALHGKPPEKHNVDKLRRSIFWGAALPVAVVGGSLITPSALVLALLWPAQILRLRLRGKSWPSAFFLLVGKFAEVQGAMTWLWRRVRRRPSELIEYK